MPTTPLAYFITFSTYGAWLHGRERGSVDKSHNVPGTPFLPSDPTRHDQMRENMREPPYLLDALRRPIVLQTLIEVAAHRGWRLLACHLRSTHVHAVVLANAPPEKVMGDFKAYASRRLKEKLGESADRKRWTQHGSTQYPWSRDEIAQKCEYTIDGQGAPMSVYDGRNHTEPDA